jgi:DNA-binding response OmpR family regulator
MEHQTETLLGKRILLVEDERSMRETLGHLLRLDDHTVIEANNGAEALGLFAPDRFDLVLTDYVLPFLKGTELSARIKHLAPHQAILMITGHQMMAGRHTRVDGVLQKPFGQSELRAALVNALKCQNSKPLGHSRSGTQFYQRIPMQAKQEAQ